MSIFTSYVEEETAQYTMYPSVPLNRNFSLEIQNDDVYKDFTHTFYFANFSDSNFCQYQRRTLLLLTVSSLILDMPGNGELQGRSQSAEIVTHIKGRLLDQAVVLFNCVPF